MHRWIGLVALIGCGGPDDGSGKKHQDPPDETVDLPSPYVADEDTVPEPTAQLSEVGAALQAGVDAVMQVTPAAVRTAYDAAMTKSDAFCPYFFSGPDGDYWFDDCTSDQGADFSGYAFGADLVGVYDPTYGVTYDTWYVAGAATIQTAAGETMVLGGTAYEVTYDQGVAKTWQSIVQGTFTWDGPEADGTWMALNYDPDLSTYFVYYPGYGGHASVIDGGIGRLGSSGQWAVAYDNVTAIDAFLGSSCGAEPSGTISVRATDGSWYDIRFHGPDGETFETSGPCDGCGEVFFHGEPVGEVCADFSSWLGWEEAPW